LKVLVEHARPSKRAPAKPVLENIKRRNSQHPGSPSITAAKKSSTLNPKTLNAGAVSSNVCSWSDNIPSETNLCEFLAEGQRKKGWQKQERPEAGKSR
jgi:hypothetical protein